MIAIIFAIVAFRPPPKPDGAWNVARGWRGVDLYLFDGDWTNGVTIFSAIAMSISATVSPSVGQFGPALPDSGKLAPIHSVGFSEFIHHRRETMSAQSAPSLTGFKRRRIVPKNDDRSIRWSGLIIAAELRHNLPAGLLHAVVGEESAYDRLAISPRGALGLSQLMPETAKMVGVVNPFDPWDNLNGGGRYMRQLIDRFGTISLALAAYNAGPDAVVRARGIPPYRETRTYVARVMHRWQRTVRERLSNLVVTATCSLPFGDRATRLAFELPIVESGL